MDFEAPWDRTTKITTAIALLLLMAVAVTLYVTTREQKGAHLLLPILELLLVGIVAGSYVFAPRGFRVEADAVLIRRPAGAIRIPMTQIRRVDKLPRDALKKTVRTFGNGGLFGFYGRFWNRNLGSFRMYVTDRSKLVLVEADVRYVLSPDRPDLFVDAVRARLRT